MDKWDYRFAEMAVTISKWSSCYKTNRQIGAVIVRDKRILTTGYNGAPAGIKSCKERGECMRQKYGVQSGTRQEFCYAVHAEQNALIQAAKLGLSVQGATLYCTHYPCTICARLIVNAGISRIVYIYDYPDDFSKTLLAEGGVKAEKIDLENRDV